MGGEDEHADLGRREDGAPLQREDMPHQMRDLQAVPPVVHRERIEFASSDSIKNGGKDAINDLNNLGVELAACLS